MPVYEEEINLKDGISGPALSASAKMKTLTDAIKSTQTALVKAQATGNVGQFKKLSSDLTAYQSAASEASSGTMGLQEEMAAMTGGLSIAVEAVGAVALAFGAAVVAGASLAIEANELKLQMTTLFDALGNGQTSGAETIGMLDQLGDRIGRTRKELAPMAQQMMALGITELPALEKAVTANASAMALMGDKGTAAFSSVMKQVELASAAGGKMKNPLKAMADLGLGQGQDVAASMGISLKTLQSQIKAGSVDAKKFGDAIQDALIKKGAGPLARAGMSLTNVWAKFQENISKLFEDVEVGPFLEQVKDLFDIFGQGQNSGKALKSGIGGFFKEVFASATKVVPLVRHFLLDTVIFGIKAYIALKPMLVWFASLKQNHTVMLVVSKAFVALKAVLITIGAVIGVVIAAFAVMVATGVAVGVSMWALIGTFLEVSQKITDTITGLVSSALEMGTNFVSGLVAGITGGIGKVVGAVKGLADGAKNTFVDFFKIGSPSKVMAELGGHLGSGVVQGLDGSQQDVNASSISLGKMAVGGVASGGASSGGGGGKGGVNVTLEAGAIVIQGAGAGAAEITEEMISMIFERVALAQGL